MMVLNVKKEAFPKERRKPPPSNPKPSQGRWNPRRQCLKGIHSPPKEDLYLTHPPPRLCHSWSTPSSPTRASPRETSLTIMPSSSSHWPVSQSRRWQEAIHLCLVWMSRSTTENQTSVKKLYDIDVVKVIHSNLMGKGGCISAGFRLWHLGC